MSPRPTRPHDLSSASRTVLPNVLRNGISYSEIKGKKQANLYENIKAKPNTNKLELDSILQKINQFKGKRGDESIIQTYNKCLVARTIENEFLDSYQKNTIDVITKYEECHPKVSKWMMENEFNWVRDNATE